MRQAMRAIALATTLAVVGCSGTEESTKPIQEPSYDSPRQVTESVPTRLAPEYQHAIECRMREMEKAGREPEIDTATATAVLREVRAGHYAPPGC